jgi:hypothetical protein
MLQQLDTQRKAVESVLARMDGFVLAKTVPALALAEGHVREGDFHHNRAGEANRLASVTHKRTFFDMYVKKNIVPRRDAVPTPVRVGRLSASEEAKHNALPRLIVDLSFNQCPDGSLLVLGAMNGKETEKMIQRQFPAGHSESVLGLKWRKHMNIRPLLLFPRDVALVAPMAVEFLVRTLRRLLYWLYSTPGLLAY